MNNLMFGANDPTGVFKMMLGFTRLLYESECESELREPGAPAEVLDAEFEVVGEKVDMIKFIKGDANEKELCGN